jgi:hypothetical protein
MLVAQALRHGRCRHLGGQPAANPVTVHLDTRPRRGAQTRIGDLRKPSGNMACPRSLGDQFPARSH